MTNDEEIAKKINSAIFPGLQGGPLVHVIAAKAVAFGEILQPVWKDYAKQVKANAKVLGEVLMKRGYDIVSGGTDNHLMLVDLGRNDVGRVAKPGTVKVTDLMRIERYSHVMHIVSDVEAIIDDKYDMFDLFAATFTAGTMTGAPKIKAMELIAEFEGIKRNFYSGSIAYFGFDGNMDSAITIRTTMLTHDTVIFQAGAGIVADSNPEDEYLEVHNKLAANIATLKDLS